MAKKDKKESYTRKEVINIIHAVLLATGKEIKTTMHVSKSYVEFEGKDVDKWIKKNV